MSFNLGELAENLPSVSPTAGPSTPYPQIPRPQPQQTHSYDQYIAQFEAWRQRVIADGALAGPPPVFQKEDYFSRLVRTHTPPFFMAVPPRCRDPPPRLPKFWVYSPSQDPTPPSSRSDNGDYQPPSWPCVNLPRGILRPEISTSSQNTPSTALGKSIMAKPEVFEGDKTKFM